MQSLAVAPWTEDEIIEALHANGRQIAFRYERLNSANESQGDLEKVISGSVANNALADIPRTAKFRIHDSEPINYLIDRIRPWFRLKMGEELIDNPISESGVEQAGTFLLPDSRDDFYTDGVPPTSWSLPPNAVGSDPVPPYSSAWTREDDSQHYFQGVNKSFAPGLKLIVWFMIPHGSTATGVQLQTQRNGAWGPRFHVGDIVYTPSSSLGPLPQSNQWQAFIINLEDHGYVSGDSVTGLAFSTVQGVDTANGGPVYFDSAVFTTGDIYHQNDLPRTVEQWAEWPLGIFLPVTPKRSIGSTGPNAREIEAYDQSLVLKDDKIGSRYTVAAGANVIDAVGAVLTDAGILLRNLVPTDETLPVARDWAPGTSRAKIIADLLSSINYRSLYFNGAGYAVAEPYQAPGSRPIGYTYTTKDRSLIYPDALHEFDLFGIANHWVAVVSEPDRPPLSAEYTNSNAESPTSTVSRGRTITDVLSTMEATSQTALDAKVERAAFEASQVYEAIEFSTGIMPHHEDADLIQLEYPGLINKANFVEHTWSMELKAGAQMKHRIRRVVTI